MAYGAYLKLDQKVLYNGDYSDTNKLTGTIYTDAGLSSAFNLTGYTLKVRMFERDSTEDWFDNTATIVTAGSGTWSYAIADNDLPSAGIYIVAVELSKSGEVMTTLNNVEILIKSGPTS